ncbi:MAG: hypothetical protein V1760_00550 [Candidatus Peregrinibacteria bacterium]
MREHKEYIRHHAHKHHEQHLKLKELLRHIPPKEKVWGTFLTTFAIAMVAIGIYANWGKIVEAFTPELAPPPPQTHGFKTGVNASIKVEKQAENEYRNLLASIPTAGGMAGIKTSHLLSQKTTPPINYEESVRKTVQTTTELSTGQHLTKLPQKQVQGLSKSVLATYYLGEKTISMDSVLKNDTQILGQMNNALSVDLFDYLNQSASRADSLNGYLNLLETLAKKAESQITDLNSKIAFLQTNFQTQEGQIQRNEEAFFQNLQIFNGPNAEENLKQFIGLQENNVEIKAKIGAYQGLRDYYLFFQPRLTNMITAIRANRDALIAGVKVTEIQNMTLPLIIRER